MGADFFWEICAEILWLLLLWHYIPHCCKKYQPAAYGRIHSNKTTFSTLGEQEGHRLLLIQYLYKANPAELPAEPASYKST
jgi:hypothetical protein